jgi:hypothetical protein
MSRFIVCIAVLLFYNVGFCQSLNEVIPFASLKDYDSILVYDDLMRVEIRAEYRDRLLRQVFFFDSTKFLHSVNRFEYNDERQLTLEEAKSCLRGVVDKRNRCVNSYTRYRKFFYYDSRGRVEKEVTILGTKTHDTLNSEYSYRRRMTVINNSGYIHNISEVKYDGKGRVQIKRDLAANGEIIKIECYKYGKYEHSIHKELFREYLGQKQFSPPFKSDWNIYLNDSGRIAKVFHKKFHYLNYWPNR